MRFNFNLDDIKYLKIQLKDENGNAHLIKSAIRTISDSEITANAKYNENLKIIMPQEVLMTFVCSDGIYSTRTKLKYKRNDEPYMFFVFETPQGLEHVQNREYFRVITRYPCTFYPQVKGEILKYESFTYDISANGASIMLLDDISPDRDSELVLRINNRQISVLASYVRSEQVDMGYKISVSFKKISESDRDLISQACIQTQLEQKRNSLK